MAGGDPAHYAALAAGTAVLVAAIALFAWAVRAGAIVNFISETVLVGFKSGVALYLASTQLPKLCGFKGSHGDFWERSGHFIRHAGETNPASLAIGVAALAVLALGKKFLPNKPVGLVVVVGSLVLGATVDLAAYGVQTLGEVPQGLPAFGLHGLRWSDINTLLPLAHGLFPARRGGNRGDRPDVRPQTRLPARQRPGIPRPGRRQSGGRPRPGLSDQRRHVTIAGQRGQPARARRSRDSSPPC